MPDAQLVGEIEEILPPDRAGADGQRAGGRRTRPTRTSSSPSCAAFLLAFGGIALFVGSFVIANSLSITIAQRTREFATLRTIGATNRQVLGSVIVEALVVGVVASVVGLFLGLLLAKGLFGLFDAVGFTLPNTGLVFEPRTVVIALARGDPRDAARERLPGPARDDGAADRGGARGRGAARASRSIGSAASCAQSRRRPSGSSSASSRSRTTPGNTLVSVLLAALGLILILFGCALFPSRTVGALVSIALGFAALLYGLFVPGLGTTGVLLWMGVGVLLVFFGVARVSTRLIPRLAVLMSPIARWAVFLLSVALLAVLHAAVLAPPPRRVGPRRQSPCASSRSSAARS